MSDKWAYLLHGRLRNLDEWDWLRPEGYITQGNSNSWPLLVTSQIVHKNEINLEEGRHVIGFDGKNWFAGHTSLPSAFLDPAKYSPDHFSYDKPDPGAGATHGRPMHYTYGHISETNHFPERIPLVSKQSIAELHEKHVIPIWDTPSREREKAVATKALTAYEPPHTTILLSEHLPAEAIDELRKAHTAGKPILLHYEPGTKEWTRVQNFAEDLAEKAAENAKSSSTSTVTETIVNQAEKTAPAAESWVARAWKHPAGKAGIIGGGLALAGAAGYWVLRSKDEGKGESQGQSAGK